MKRSSIKFNLLSKYLISYSVILIIPLIIMLYIINNVVFVLLQNEIINGNTKNLIKAEDQLEKYFSDMQRISASVSSNYRLAPYNVNSSIYSSKEAISDLRIYQQSNKFISEIIYYIHGNNTILTSTQRCDLDLFIKQLYPFSKGDPQLFQDTMKSISIPTVNSINLNSRDFLQYTYPIKPYDPYATIIFLINKSEIAKLFSSIFSEFDENILLIDENNNIIFSLQDPSKIQMDNLISIINQKTENKPQQYLMNKNFIFSYQKSQTYNWSYVSIVDRNSLMKKLDNVKLEVIISFLIIFILGSVFIIFATYKNYIPIYKLIKKISDRLSHPIENVRDLELINVMFDEMLDNNQNLNTTLLKQKPIMKEYLLNELLKGHKETFFDFMMVEDDLKDMYGKNYFFQVVILKSRLQINSMDKQNLFSSLNSKLNLNYGNSIKFLNVESIDEKQLILVLCYDQPSKIDDLLKLIYSTAVLQLEKTIIISTGTPHKELVDIGISYKEATTSLGNIDSNDFYTNNYDKLNYPFIEIETLSDEILHEDISQITITLNKIYDILIYKDIPDVFIRCIILDLFNLFIKLMMELNIDYKNIKQNYIQILSIREFKDQTILKEIFNITFIEICTLICSKIKVKSNVYDKIMDYIQQHYCENSFSTESMAGNLSISVPYLCQVFKEQMNETINAYIWDLRYKKAVYLLQTTDMLIKEIVKQIGYIDVSSFTRKFKLLTGVTPGEFRKMKHN